MRTQSKKPEPASSDFSETFTSLDELFPLNEYKIESDILSDQRSSTEPEPLQNGRISHALAGKWGVTTEFKASPISNETFQTVPDSTLFEMLKAGAGKHVDLFMLFQTSYFRHEFKGDEKAETESHWIERDFSGVTWAHTPVTYERMSELTGVPASTLSKQVQAFAEYRDSQGDPFLVVIPEGQWAKDAYRKRRQDGNVYVLNGVRLPSDRGLSKKQTQSVVQNVVQSVSHYDTPQTGSTKGENTRVSVSDESPKVERHSHQNWRDPDANSGDLVSINKDLSKDFTQLTSELTRTLGGDEGSTKRTDVTSNQLTTFSDLTPAQQNLILGAFNVDRPQMLTKAQMTRGLTFTFAKPTDPVDDEFRELATKGKQERAEKKRAEAEFLRQEREKQQAIEAENAEIARYGHVLTEAERQEQIESQRANTLAYGKKLMTEFRESCKPKINTPQT